MAEAFVDRLPRPLAVVFILTRDTIVEFGRDKAARLAAALAYYAAFSIAPLLLVVIGLIGFLWEGEEAAVQARLMAELADLIGPEGADLIRTMLDNTTSTGSGLVATIAGIAGLVWGSSRLFAQLQGSLNDVWKVKPVPGRGILGFVVPRGISFSMVLVLGLLMIMALVASALLSALNEFLDEIVPLPIVVIEFGNHALAIVVMTVLFAAIYRFLPDAEVRWRDVWVGALLTAILFNLGKFGISTYLSTTATTSTYGAAGSFVLLLLWIYYTSMIFFVGAEFTKVYARHYGRRIQPSENAVSIRSVDSLLQHYEDRPPQPTVSVRPSSSTVVQTQTKRPFWRRAMPLMVGFLLGWLFSKND